VKERRATGIYALTVWQPWADAIAHGSKRTENRPWPPPAAVIGQVIAIHAGMQVDHGAEPPDGENWPDPGIPLSARPRGVIIAVARLAGCHRATDPRCMARPCSPWAAWVQFHWQLDQVRPLPEPIPARGSQRLWRVEPRLERELARRVPLPIRRQDV
jgi:ASCH domain